MMRFANPWPGLSLPAARQEVGLSQWECKLPGAAGDFPEGSQGEAPSTCRKVGCKHPTPGHAHHTGLQTGAHDFKSRQLS